MRTPNLLDDALTNKTYVNCQQNDFHTASNIEMQYSK